jgi:hypothetical protein
MAAAPCVTGICWCAGEKSTPSASARDRAQAAPCSGAIATVSSWPSALKTFTP